MSFRSTETPMEFEYENKVGRLGSSPFARLADQKNDRSFGSQIKSPSPVRNPTFNVPTLPQTPQHAPFRDQINTDFSSAAESSPENGGHGADSEDTPDPQRMGNVTVFRGGSASKTHTPPAKRLSWFRRLKTKPNSNSNALVRRTNKRKRREAEKEDQQLVWSRPGDDTDYNDSSRPSSSEGSDSRSKSKSSFKKKARDVGTLPAVLSFIHEHPQLPTTLAFYGQMLFSLFIMGMLAWVIWTIWSSILHQIEIEAEKLGMDVLLEIRQCERHWTANRCNDPANVAPALERMCAEWDHCQKQDWKAQGRAKIGAHTFGSILNQFFEPLSTKFIICAVALIALLVWSPHQLFGTIRRSSEAHLQHQHQSQAPGPGFFPQTPSRQLSKEWANQGMMMNEGYYTPQMQSRQWGGNGMEWGSPSKRLEGRSRSPVKHLEFKTFS